MRLTNVGHLRLPFGRLYGYDVAVSAPAGDLPVSFDQRRHVGAGERPGSWMALSFELAEPIPRDRLAEAWLRVIERHGTLRTVFVEGDDGPRLHEVQIGAGGWIEHPIGTGQAVNEALRTVLDADCTPYSRPSHRLCVLEKAAGPTVVVAADHAHVDMWSMLVVARDLLAALTGPLVGEVPAFVGHTRAMADRPAAPADVRARWAQILADSGGVMPRFPLPLGDSEPSAERVEVRDVFDVDDSAAFSAQARSDGVSTLSAAVSVMTAVTGELADRPLRAVFPVHSRYDEAWHESVGWFITNSVIESSDPDPSACADAVREAVRLGSWPLRAILEPWGGDMPEAPGMFAISWLDLRRLPVRIDSTSIDAQYVGAVIRTDGVMLWFILDEAGLHLRCRYPDTPEARVNVGGWLDLLVTRLQGRARSSAGDVLHIGDRTFRVQRARRSDVAAIVDLLSDDDIGREREGAELERYEAAFDVVVRDRAHYLAVVRDEQDRIVATMQLTVIPGLSRGGSTRLQIEGLRVAEAERSRGLGSAMLGWAHAHGRAHGARLVQVATDEVRIRARGFYLRAGYRAGHVGLKRDL
ncbi:GNAT family N-acetyltransferase [Gordonia neofelifaecis]|uniref:GCN5-related N-acetyltransferase n=1 Tax=Gordonia neofelifaecis NRRL B-59395 TaxID=644548 RepID=F1YEI4_9ACTN|nr:GNAT family N-acetyltransferase [Gordonia neofelifaecis]EGD56817.1 GCN5-related N-acetyltransferase [Gordonia neofelifaecis NRRL B-59395]